MFVGPKGMGWRVVGYLKASQTACGVYMKSLKSLRDEARRVSERDRYYYGQKCTFLHILKGNIQQASNQEPVSTDRFSVRILKLGAGVTSGCKQIEQSHNSFASRFAEGVLSFHVFLSLYTENESPHTLLVPLFPLGVHPYGPRLPSFGADEASFYPCPPSSPMYFVSLMQCQFGF